MRKIFKNTKIKIIFYVLFFIVLIVCGVFIAYVQEKNVSPDITLAEVTENTIITMLGEYPDKPHSLIARSLQLLWFAFSVLIFGLVVGKISSIFINYSLNQKGKIKMLKKHIVICNWNKNGKEVIKQLFESNFSQKLKILIISNTVVDKREFPESYQDRINIINDDPTEHKVLSKANVANAKSIIILADEKTEKPDDQSALIALAVKHLENGLQKDLRVVAELIDVNRERHLKEAGADEIVCSMSHCSGIIAQSALFNNMSIVYQRLLSYSDESNEIYFIKPENYPKGYVGLGFIELSQKINEGRNKRKKNPCLLVGIKRDDEIMLNPRQPEFCALQKSDSLIVMAFNKIKSIK